MSVYPILPLIENKINNNLIGSIINILIIEKILNFMNQARNEIRRDDPLRQSVANLL